MISCSFGSIEIQDGVLLPPHIVIFSKYLIFAKKNKIAKNRKGVIVLIV